MAAGERRVGVADPANSLRSLAVITVPPGIWAVSTVSLADQFDPILDPRTGKPAGPGARGDGRGRDVGGRRRLVHGVLRAGM